MTDGVRQVFDGAFVADDEAAVAADSARVMRALWKTLERENWFAGTL